MEKTRRGNVWVGVCRTAGTVEPDSPRTGAGIGELIRYKRERNWNASVNDDTNVGGGK